MLKYLTIFRQTSRRCGAFGATSIGTNMSLPFADGCHCVACCALWLTSMTVPHFAYGLQFEDPQNSGCG